MKLTVFGFPVEVHVSFVVVLLLLGSVEKDPVRIALWAVLGAVSILLHELGHAFAGRALGAKPQISLYGMGGATSYVPVRPGDRGDELIVTASGPGVGIAIGLVLLAVRGSIDDGGMGTFLVDTGIWVNLGWGLFNLLPVLPLDGGRLVQAMLPGTPERRLRNARILSVVIAGVGAAVAVSAGQPFLALFAGYFGVMNLTGVSGDKVLGKEQALLDRLQEIGPLIDAGNFVAVREIAAEVASKSKTPELRTLAAQWAAAALLPLGHANQAMAELTALDRDGVTVDPTLAALVLIATGHEEAGRERLAAAQAQGPSQFDTLIR